MKIDCNTEEKYIGRIYFLIIVTLVAEAFLAQYIVSTIIRSIELLSLIGIVVYTLKLKRKKALVSLRDPDKLLYILLCLNYIYMLIRGQWSHGWQAMALYIVSISKITILPLCLIVLPNYRHIDKILYLFFIASVLSIPIWFLNMSNLIQDDYHGEVIGVYLPFFAAFLLGFTYRFSKKQTFIIYAIWGIYLILMMLNARRNVSFSLVVYALIASYYVFSNIWKKHMREVVVILYLILLSGLYVALNWENYSQHTFKRLAERSTEDSRSGVEELFFLDFTNSSISDWYFGRGVDGTYYQEMRDVNTGDINTRRSGIETGYLHMVLKGGIFFTAVIVVILLRTVFILWKTHNRDLRFIAMIVLTYLIDNYSTNPIYLFSPRSIIFWFCVSVALGIEQRNIKSIEHL